MNMTRNFEDIEQFRKTRLGFVELADEEAAGGDDDNAAEALFKRGPASRGGTGQKRKHDTDVRAEGKRSKQQQQQQQPMSGGSHKRPAGQAANEPARTRKTAAAPSPPVEGIRQMGRRAEPKHDCDRCKAGGRGTRMVLPCRHYLCQKCEGRDQVQVYRKCPSMYPFCGKTFDDIVPAS